MASDTILTAAHCVSTNYEEDPDPNSPFAVGPGTYHALIGYNIEDSLRKYVEPVAPPHGLEWAIVASMHDILVPADYTRIGYDGVDYALIRADEGVSRCAMKPLRVVDAVPDPPLPGVQAGTFRAWKGVFVTVLGNGGTQPDCSAVTNQARSYLTALSEVSVWPDEPGWHVQAWGASCPGDSGGPVLVAPQDQVVGTNLDPAWVGTLVALMSYGTDPSEPGGFSGPLLHAERPWLVQHAIDRDEDGVESWEDNCDTTYNPDQADQDGDGIGDACDAVARVDDCGDEDGDGIVNFADPCVRASDFDDSDGDGTCDADDPCPADAEDDADGDGLCWPEDNCPHVANPLQQNCNADAEAVAQVAPVGDACDTVPCVRATQTSRSHGNDWIRWTSTRYFDVEPIRVRPADMDEFTGRWGHRFCPCEAADGTPAARLLCGVRRGCRIGNVSFAPPAGAWQVTQAALEPHRASSDPRFEHQFVAPEEMPGVAPKTLNTMRWEPAAQDAGPFWSVRGAHWFHVVSENTASCPRGCQTGVTQWQLDALASHYWAGEVGDYPTVTGGYEVGHPLDWWLPPPPDCPPCAALEVMPFVHVLDDGRIAMRSSASEQEPSSSGGGGASPTSSTSTSAGATTTSSIGTTTASGDPFEGWSHADGIPEHCGAYVPDDVGVVTPFVWQPCQGGGTGCQDLVVNWTPNGDMPFYINFAGKAAQPAPVAVIGRDLGGELAQWFEMVVARVDGEVMTAVRGRMDGPSRREHAYDDRLV